MRRYGLGIVAALAAFGMTACDGSESGAPLREAAAAPAAPTASPAAALPAEAPPASVEAASPTETPDPVATLAPTAEPAPATAAAEPEAPEPGQSSAAAILRRAETANTALRSFQADFVQDLSVPLLGSSQRSRGKMYAKQPGRFSMRFTDPAGDLLVADGRNVWMYYPSTDRTQVLKATMAAGGDQVDFQKQFLSNSAARYDAVLSGAESVGGRPASVLTLTPKGPSSFRKVRIWVDTRDALVRRFEITEENESVRRIELSNLQPNATIADAIFSFTPPAGTQVFQQ